MLGLWNTLYTDYGSVVEFIELYMKNSHVYCINFKNKLYLFGSVSAIKIHSNM